MTASAAYGSRDTKSHWKQLCDTLLHNVTLLTCVFMLGLSLPAPLAGVCTSISGANTTLAMLSIGILLDLRLPRSELWSYGRMAAIRFGCAICCAAAIYFLAPISDKLRRAMMLTVFSPIASCGPVMALHCGYTGSWVAVMNSLYLLISIVSMSVLTMVLY